MRRFCQRPLRGLVISDEVRHVTRWRAQSAKREFCTLDFEGNLIPNFEISGLHENLFLINDENQLILKNPSDYEEQISYKIEVIAIDENGNSITKSFTIEIQDSNSF